MNARAWARSGALVLGLGWSAAAADISVSIGYLRVEEPPRSVLSNLDKVPEDLGLAGAELGAEDNRTTGTFLGHDYGLEIVSLPTEDHGQEAVTTAAEALAQRADYLLLDMSPEALLWVADALAADGTLLFNVSSEAVSLREKECRAGLLHTALEAPMRADALMQVALAKRWSRLAMIVGATEADKALAETYRQAARKFGIKIVSEADWDDSGDLRRAASREVPLLTQGFKDHDAVLVADAYDDFARYIEFNTWAPRPVIGATGLSPVGWSPVVEQWGAAQLQSRFETLSDRPMRARDFAAWVAVRSIGEAVTRTGSADPETLRDYMLSEAFELAAFLGRPLSFRNWNGQMRQPIPVVSARAVVGMAPLDGFEHAYNPLDSLGTDRPESICTAFKSE